MQITLFSNFSKRSNSTLQATGGTNVTVNLKDNTSIEDPAFELGAGLSTYDNVTAVLWDGRYYAVTDITSTSNGTTIISCTLDRPATFKSSITGASAFIERCADNYNVQILDPALSTESNTYMNTVKSGQILPGNFSQGVICVRAVSTAPNMESGGACSIYFFDPVPGSTYSIYDLLTALYGSNLIQSITNVFKNTFETIISCTYIPCVTASYLATEGYLNSTTLKLSDQDFSNITVLRPTQPGDGRHTYIDYEFETDLDLVKQYSTYTWRNKEPFSKWLMYLPFVGTVPINIENYIDDVTSGTTSSLLVKMWYDLTTGDMIYQEIKKTYTAGVPTEHVINEYKTHLGVNIPLAQVTGTPLKFGTSVIGGLGATLGGIASGNALIAAGGAATMIGGGVVGLMQRDVATAGSFDSNGVQLFNMEKKSIEVMQIGHPTTGSPTDYKDVIGCMYMKADTIGNHSGFIKCQNASISIPGTQADRDAINAMLNSGIFIE